MRQWDCTHGLECNPHSPAVEKNYAVWRKAGSPDGPGLPPFARNEIRLMQDLNILYIGPGRMSHFRGKDVRIGNRLCIDEEDALA